MSLNLNHNQQVEFFEHTHTYINSEGVILSGITTIISKLLFPNKYSSIPKHILEKAANYGSLIHSKCQTQDMFYSEPDCIEIENYIKLKQENNLIPIENEYLVSDNEHIATMIDNVFYSTDASVHLGDIKTTSILDKDSLSWQLSICSYLFELQNPHLKVDKLFGIWLRRDKYKLQEVLRIDDKIIKVLIESYLTDSEFINPFEKEAIQYPQINEIASIDQEVEYLKARREDLMSELQPQIESNGTYKDERITISYIAPSNSKSFDSKKFKEENPELASKYEKESAKQGYLKLTYKKEKQ